MKSSFRIKGPPGPFDDPFLYVRFPHSSRAVMFDAGELAGLSTRELLRVSDLFVSHAHMDHFISFSRLVRVHLHRTRILNVYGPTGFIERVAGTLAGFTWNISQDYPLSIVAYEAGVRAVRKVAFRASTGFVPEPLDVRPNHGVLLSEAGLKVSSVELHHGIPCLAYRLEEKTRININTEAVRSAGLVTGPWLSVLKEMVARGEPGEKRIRVSAAAGSEERQLGDLSSLYTVTDGQVLAYVVDAADTPDNCGLIRELVRGADLLYIEAAFLSSEAAMAAGKNHLTAARAGDLAAQAGVKSACVMHLSPRYQGRETELLAEAAAAAEAVPDSVTRVRAGWRNNNP